jgi:hypothetical protein
MKVAAPDACFPPELSSLSLCREGKKRVAARRTHTQTLLGLGARPNVAFRLLNRLPILAQPDSPHERNKPRREVKLF